MICPCAPCRDVRADGLSSPAGCFAEIMAETGTTGHGPCVDPWGSACDCTGTALDGECEGCWLWLK